MGSCCHLAARFTTLLQPSPCTGYVASSARTSFPVSQNTCHFLEALRGCMEEKNNVDGNCVRKGHVFCLAAFGRVQVVARPAAPRPAQCSHIVSVDYYLLPLCAAESQGGSLICFTPLRIHKIMPALILWICCRVDYSR